ncbi:helix-turn-helix domain-containing protein [Congregicoccus parvus]|uniref:helix-turn-helix domain-containing protein n=1 Tax=Congregicoccus parvus TaxID=3081749 RepID=UPI003FA59918
MSVVSRTHGFAGEHMVVLPEPVRAEARGHPLLAGLHVTDAGWFPHAQGHLVERTTGAATVLVISCMRGRGWVRVGGARVGIAPGDFVWFPAREAHAYGSELDDPWSIAWVHFSGREVGAWRDLLHPGTGVGFAIVQLATDRLDEVGLERVYPELERGYGLRRQVAAAARLRSAFVAAAELRLGSAETRPAQERVAASIEVLHEEWSRAHRLDELATGAGLSVAHYSELFRQRTGFSPIDYLIRLRVRRACALLDGTASSVSEIARRVGYEDPYYFARVFRRVMGMSPRAYRAVPKG